MELHLLVQAGCLMCLMLGTLGQTPANLVFTRSTGTATVSYIYYMNFRGATSATATDLNSGIVLDMNNCFIQCNGNANCLAADFDTTAATTVNCKGYLSSETPTCTGCSSAPENLVAMTGTNHMIHPSQCFSNSMTTATDMISTGTTITGGVITIPTGQGPEEEHCKYACQVTINCVAANYVVATRQCTLVQSSSGTVTAGASQTCLPRSSQTGTNTFYLPCVSATTFSGYDMIYRGYPSVIVGLGSESFVTNEESCRGLCDRLTTCIGYSHYYVLVGTQPDFNGGRCRLYFQAQMAVCTTTMFSDRRQCSSEFGKSRNWYTFIKQGRCVVTPYKQRFFRPLTGMRAPTASSTVASTASSLMNCAMLCFDDAQCGAFDLQGTTCRTIQRTVECPLTLVSDAGWTHYRLDILCRRNRWDERRGSIINRNNPQTGVTNLGTCIESCEQSEACRGITFDGIQQICYHDVEITSNCNPRMNNDPCCVSMRKNNRCALVAGFQLSRNNLTLPASAQLQSQGGISSEADCLNMCQTQTGATNCAGVVWDRDTFTCYFYISPDDVSTCNIGDINTCCSIHSKGPCGVACQVNAFETMVVNVRHAAGVMQSGVSGLAACANLCFLDANCGGFDLNVNTCYTITGEALCATGTTAMTGFTHYRKHYACLMATWDTRPNSYIALSNAQTANSLTLKQCMDLCTTTNAATCRGVSYDLNSLNTICYLDLVTAVNCLPRITNQNCFVSLRVKHKCAERAGFAQSLDNMNIPTTDANLILQAGTNSEATCLTNCQARPMCSGLVWDRTNLICYFYEVTPISNTAVCPVVTSAQCCVTHSKAMCPVTMCTQTVGHNIGGGTRQPSHTTLTTCSNACQADATCVAFDWNKETAPYMGTRCWFHTTSTGCVAPGPNTCCDSYRCVGSPDPCPSVEGYSVFTNTRVQGATQATAVNTQLGCSQACTADATCEGFDFDAAGNTCWLHKMDSICGPFEVWAQCTHGRKPRWQCAWRMTDTSITGGTINNQINTLADCERECRRDSNCRGYDFVTATNVCYLHTTTTICNTRQATTGVVHHRLRTHICAGEPVIDATQNANIQGGVSQGTRKSALACFFECVNQANPVCYGVDYEKVSQTCWFLQNMATECAGPTTNECCDHIRKQNACVTSQCTISFSRSNNNNRQGATQMGGIANEQACIDNCCLDTACYSVDWDKSNSQCWKHSMTSHCSNPLTSNTCCNHHEKDPNVTPCAGAPGYTTTDNRIILGATLRQGVTTLDACRQACTAETTCGGLDWVTSSSQCWIHTVANECSGTLIVNTCCTHHRKNSACGTTGYTTTDNRIILGATLRQGVTTLDACRQACTAETTCGGLDWVTSSSQCWIHTVANECSGTLLENTCCTHHRKNSACATTGYTVSNNNLKLGGAESTNSGAHANEAACAAICTSDSNCGGIDYNKDTNRCWIHTISTECSNSLVQNTCCNHQEKNSACTGTGTYTVSNNNLKTGGTESTNSGAHANEAACVASCTSDSNCGGIDYNKDNNRCWIHTISNECSKTLVSNNCCNHQEKNSACTGTGTYTVSNNNLKTGGTESTNSAAHNNEAACVASCTSDSNCGGIDYDKNNNRCWIHTISNECSKTLVSNTCCNHQEKNSACTGTATYTVSNNNLKTGGTESGSSAAHNNEAACVASCTSDSTCGGIDYNKDTNRCWIHTISNECSSSLVSNNCCNHQQKNSACTGTATYTVSNNNLKTGGAESGSSSAHNNEAACVASCTSDSTCGGIDYNKDTNRCWIHTISNECSSSLFSNNCCNHQRKNSITCP